LALRFTRSIQTLSFQRSRALSHSKQRNRKHSQVALRKSRAVLEKWFRVD
jgi:hypothetical protein